MISEPADPFDLLASRGGSVDDAPGSAPGQDESGPRSWRRALGWSPTSAPVALLLVAGFGAGPQGINLLSPAVLSFLDPVVPVALAALGVLVGLGVGGRRADERYLLAAACLDAGMTMVIVTGGIAVVVIAATTSAVGSPWPLASAAGICAATSLTLPTGNVLEPRTPATRVAELGVLLPIVAGGLVMAFLRGGSSVAALTLVAQATAVTVALATAGWLLLTRASSETEQRVIAISALLLVGGAADALSLSALLGGLVAGVFWRFAGRQPRESLSRDVLFVQHPLVLLVLLVAGARAIPSAASLGLAGAYVLLRAVARLAGGMVASRATGPHRPRDLGIHLLSPGVFGVAFALGAARPLGTEASLLLTTVVVGTIGSELVALLLQHRRLGE